MEQLNPSYIAANEAQRTQPWGRKQESTVSSPMECSRGYSELLEEDGRTLTC